MSKHLKKTTRFLEKLGSSHNVKSFAFGAFHECIVVKRANDVRQKMGHGPSRS